MDADFLISHEPTLTFSSADPPSLKLWRGRHWQRKNCQSLRD